MNCHEFRKLKAGDFNLEATLESGQVFGFSQVGSEVFRGFVRGALLDFFKKGSCLCVRRADGASRDVREKAIRDYFDLDRDLTSLYGILSADDRLEPVLTRFKGLRVIRQDPWEALGCFILSSNNNIKRIRGIFRNLSVTFAGNAHQFPGAERVASSSPVLLKRLGLGYRAPYLYESARRVARDPEFFYGIRRLDYGEAKARLMNFPGVGEKVADCVLLFGFQKTEAFPVDVWVLRAMRKLFFSGRKVSENKIRAFSRERWGKAAGYVQQYVYHGAKIGAL